MSDCTERGHHYQLILVDGEVLYGCVNGCGDIMPINDLEHIGPYMNEIKRLLQENYEMAAIQ